MQKGCEALLPYNLNFMVYLKIVRLISHLSLNHLAVEASDVGD